MVELLASCAMLGMVSSCLVVSMVVFDVEVAWRPLLALLNHISPDSLG